MAAVRGYRTTFGIHCFFAKAQGEIASVDHYSNGGTVAQLCAEILKCDVASEARMGTGREKQTASELGHLSCCTAPSSRQTTEYQDMRLYDVCISDLKTNGVSCVYMALGRLASRLTLRQCETRIDLGNVVGGSLRPFFMSEPDGIGQQLGLVLFLIALANDMGDRDALFQHVFSNSDGATQADIAGDASVSYKELMKLWQRVSVLCARALEYGVNAGILISGVLCPGFLQAVGRHAPALLATKYQDVELVVSEHWMNTLLLLTQHGIAATPNRVFVGTAFARTTDLACVMFYESSVPLECVVHPKASPTTDVRARLLKGACGHGYELVHALNVCVIRSLRDNAAEWFCENGGVLGCYGKGLTFTPLCSF